MTVGDTGLESPAREEQPAAHEADPGPSQSTSRPLQVYQRCKIRKAIQRN